MKRVRAKEAGSVTWKVRTTSPASAGTCPSTVMTPGEASSMSSSTGWPAATVATLFSTL